MKIIHGLRLSILALTLALAGQVLGQSSSSNGPVLMQVTGQKQGLIRGEVTQKGREGQHRVLAYSHEIVIPRDATTGLPTGKRQHQPFRIVKLLNAGSPSLMTAMTSGENLSTVVIDVWTPTAVGTELKLVTYTLTDARIVSLRPWMPNHSDPSAQTYPPAEEIAFTYQSIKVTYQPGGTESSDDWNASSP
jgi:type VI secretion system secreted protein Hcp